MSVMPRRRYLYLASITLFLIHTLALAFVRDSNLSAFLSNTVQLAAGALVFLSCLHAAQRSRPYSRLFWRLICVSYLLWTIAQTSWLVHELLGKSPGIAFNATNGFFFFSMFPFVLVLLLDPSSEAGKIDQQRNLDLLQIAIVVFSAYVYVFEVPSQFELPEKTASVLLGQFFVARNILIVCVLLIRVILTRSHLERSLFGTASICIGVYALLSRLGNYAFVNWTANSGSWFDLCWSSPFLISAVVIAHWNEPEPETTNLPHGAGLRGLMAQHLMPTLLPLFVLLMAARIADSKLATATAIIFLSFACYSLRLAVTQYRQQQAVEALQRAEARFRMLFDHNPLPIMVLDSETHQFLEVNESAISKYGYSREEFMSFTADELRPREDVPTFRQAMASGPHIGEGRHVLKHGSIVDVLVMAKKVEFGGRDAKLVIVQDISERKQLEQQLRQAQKMEAVGRLAGGIAHDFNNLLTVIAGYSQVVLDRISYDAELRGEVQQIEAAAKRATELTRQLLAFSRRQMLQPQVIKLDTVVENVQRMLQRVIGEHIELVTRFAPELGFVKVDPGQIEQILMNLAVNARDAMTGGGKLIFETTNIELKEGFSKEQTELPPGSYVLLTVTDTGSGIEPQLLQQIFEPFFTTKKGTGTGLGLSTVYGITKQSGGAISVESEVGVGTTFKIYLPRVEERPAESTAESAATIRPGNETVLLVEDDAGVRGLTRRILGQSGYNVLEAGRAEDAQRICREHQGTINLMLTDLVMPGIGGRELACQLSLTRPQMKILYMSGYTDQETFLQGLSEGSVNFIQKPFTPHALAQKVREILDMPENDDCALK